MYWHPKSRMEVKIRNERRKTKTNKRELLYGTCIQIVKYETIRLACTVSALSLNEYWGYNCSVTEYRLRN